MASTRAHKPAKPLSRAAERERKLTEAAQVEMPARTDVLVVGAGAAGLTAAIVAKEAGVGALVLEADLECGKSILATGNGRCNFTNTQLLPEMYSNPELARSIMGEPQEALQNVLDFFSACGLSWVEEDGGRLYPRSRQAASVRNILLARCWRDGICLAPARKVVDAKRVAGWWNVTFVNAWDGTQGSIKARALIIATGGALHTYREDEPNLTETLGLKITPYAPVLCALKTQAALPGLFEKLDGRRAHCTATLKRGGQIVTHQSGEVLFRPYGISGIMSFDLSRYARPGDMIELDLAPEVDAWEVDQLIAHRWGDTSALDGILDPVIAATLIEAAGGVYTDGLAWRVAPLVKGLPMRFVGWADTEHAQVTRGGVEASSLNDKVLTVKNRTNLYVCGEAVDMDAACGGYNLTWAWLSGMRCASDAAHIAKIAIAEEQARAEEAAKKRAAEKAKREAAAKAKKVSDTKAAKKSGVAAAAKISDVAAAAKPAKTSSATTATKPAKTKQGK